MNDRIRILLVDDSPYFLAAAGEFLRIQEALVVETAAGADEAVLRVQQRELDVILLDLNLGERCGLDLIPSFRAHLPQARIIVLSIMNEAAYRAASLRAGADAFVDKIGMSKTLVPVILQQLDRPAGEQKADQPTALKSEQPEIAADQESMK